MVTKIPKPVRLTEHEEGDIYFVLEAGSHFVALRRRMNGWDVLCSPLSDVRSGYARVIPCGFDAMTIGYYLAACYIHLILGKPIAMIPEELGTLEASSWAKHNLVIAGDLVKEIIPDIAELEAKALLDLEPLYRELGQKAGTIIIQSEPKADKFKVPEKYRVPFMSMPGDLFGAFAIPHPKDDILYYVMASSGEPYEDNPGTGWDHVSVSLRNKAQDKMIERTPTWEEMCLIKAMFWEEEATVLQYHPAKSDYVNIHNYVLHLWRPLAGPLMKPPKIQI